MLPKASDGWAGAPQDARKYLWEKRLAQTCPFLNTSRCTTKQHVHREAFQETPVCLSLRKVDLSRPLPEPLIPLTGPRKKPVLVCNKLLGLVKSTSSITAFHRMTKTREILSLKCFEAAG